MTSLVISAAVAATAIAASPPPESSAGRVSIVEAQLTGVRDITGQSGAPCICDDDGRVILDGSYRLYFSPRRTLDGPRVTGRLSYEQASARPLTRRRYLLVISHGDAGEVVEWAGLAQNGLCLRPEEITAYGLERTAQQNPCRN